MNKKITSVFLVIIIIGGVLFFMKKPNVSVPSALNSTSTPVLTATSTNSVRSLMAEVIKSGGSYKCTFVENAQGTDSNGTIYITGSSAENMKLRIDFKTKVAQADMTVDSHMITDGLYVYTWSSATPQGIKIKTVSSDSVSVDSSGKYNYSCVPWVSDNSVFSAPKDIIFSESK